LARNSRTAQILERIYWRAWLVVAIVPGVVLIVVAVKLLRPAVGYMLAGS
jgi:hypothetical protein